MFSCRSFKKFSLTGCWMTIKVQSGPDLWFPGRPDLLEGLLLKWNIIIIFVKQLNLYYCFPFSNTCWTLYFSTFCDTETGFFFFVEFRQISEKLGCVYRCCGFYINAVSGAYLDFSAPCSDVTKMSVCDDGPQSGHVVNQLQAKNPKTLWIFLWNSLGV